ncbi:small ribosomal subunit protein uS9m-like [Ciona intestinalis]
MSVVNKYRRLIVTQQKLCRWISTCNRDYGRRILRMDKSYTNLQKMKQIKYPQDYIEEKVVEYNLGTRRLAVMMGQDETGFDDRKIKEALKYLFPTDLSDRKTRPTMEHPNKIFPAQLKPQADPTGRPYHSLFYTSHPQFYDLMHDIYNNLLQLQDIRRKATRMGKSPHEESLNLQSSKWISKSKLETNFLDSIPISNENFRSFILQLERLVEEPHARDREDIIMKFRDELPVQRAMTNIAQIHTDHDGRKYVEEVGGRKTGIAEVKLIANGGGGVTINGVPMQMFFDNFLEREMVIAPLSLLGLVGRFDIVAKVDGGFSGTWCQLNGTTDDRQDIANTSILEASFRCARGLRAFIGEDDVEVLRRGGLLTRDPRKRERKKPGQWKARKKFTWKKR